MMTIALTREVPDSITDCVLTHLAREPIDLVRAREQHHQYEEVLTSLGLHVERLPATPTLPDSVFVEDTAIVLEDVAVISRPGAPSRQAELETVRRTLARYRRLEAIAAPGTLDGGDVLVLDRELVVGLSNRTNAEGARQLAELTSSSGLSVRTMPVTACLHLKSAVTRAGRDLVLLNPHWVDAAAFRGWRIVECDPSEPFGANALLVDDTVVYAAEYPRTRERLERAGCRVVSVPAGELAKAEGGVTCCSLLVDATSADTPTSAD